MTYGIIDRKNHKYYTYMSKVFQAMDNAQLQYNWLITGCICYPQNNDIEKLLDQEYCWVTGDELSAIIEQEDFQWIWGCLCGFSKDITMEEALKYPLPSAEDYDGYYQNRPLREFCVSVFRQNQEYHVINVHDGAYSPWLQLSRQGGAVCAPCTA